MQPTPAASSGFPALPPPLTFDDGNSENKANDATAGTEKTRRVKITKAEKTNS